ncbi:hypothetical protein [Actinomadura rudentiformis]|uniref:hypothetical protein n=1 Tax=Actinomadura rudentiformis TaxID=359158 RepID=UPI001CEF609E|nr:hypothetical protein [Actinomadura rudentiformis]
MGVHFQAAARTARALQSPWLDDDVAGFQGVAAPGERYARVDEPADDANAVAAQGEHARGAASSP